MLSLRRTDSGRGITRSAAFRLTLQFAATFVICLLLADVVVGLTARWAVRRQAIAGVEETLGSLQAAAANGGVVAVSEAVRARGNGGDEDGLAVGLQDASGAALAGDLTLPAPRLGWSQFVPPGADLDEDLWVKSARLSDGSWLSVGASTERYHDIAEEMAAAALWIVATALPLALVCGALLSRAVLGRLATDCHHCRGGARRVALAPRAGLRSWRRVRSACRRPERDAGYDRSPYPKSPKRDRGDCA